MEVHPCRGLIHPQGPWGHYMLRSIPAHGPSILRALRGPSSPEHIHPEDSSPNGPWGPIHPCPLPIYAEGLSISGAHGGPTMPKANPLGQSIPRVHGDPSMCMAHPSRGPIGFHPYPKTHGPIFSGPIYSERLSLPRSHTSLHRADVGPSSLSMHRCLGPSAHPSRGFMGANP